MCKRIDLVKRRFGRLVVIAYAETVGKRRHRVAKWLCQCDCGNKHTVRGGDLRSGKTQSCGCLEKENLRELTQKNLLKMNKDSEMHGMTKTSSYKLWSSMKQRCQNKNHSDYAHYGARGIVVCERWVNSFANFYADMGHRPKGLMIERIDNDKGYSPENCKWATAGEQARNRRSTRIVQHNGKKQCLKDWAKELGIGYKSLLKNPQLLLESK